MFTQNLLEAVNSVVNPSTVQEILQESKTQIDQWLQKEVLNQEQYQEVLSLFNQFNDLMKTYKGQLKNIAEEDFFEQPQKQKEFLDQFQFSQWFSKKALNGRNITFQRIKDKLNIEIKRLEWYHENAPTKKSIRATKSASKDYVDLGEEFVYDDVGGSDDFELILPLNHVASGKIASAGYKGIHAKVCVAEFDHFIDYNKHKKIIIYLLHNNEKYTIAYDPFKDEITEFNNSNNEPIDHTDLLRKIEKSLSKHRDRIKAIYTQITKDLKEYDKILTKLDKIFDEEWSDEIKERKINAFIRKNWKYEINLIEYAVTESEYKNVPFTKRLTNEKQFEIFQDKNIRKKFNSKAEHFSSKINKKILDEHPYMIALITEEDFNKIFGNGINGLVIDFNYGGPITRSKNIVSHLQRFVDRFGWKAVMFNGASDLIYEHYSKLSLPKIDRSIPINILDSIVDYFGVNFIIDNAKKEDLLYLLALMILDYGGKLISNKIILNAIEDGGYDSLGYLNDVQLEKVITYLKTRAIHEFPKADSKVLEKIPKLGELFRETNFESIKEDLGILIAASIRPMAILNQKNLRSLRNAHHAILPLLTQIDPSKLDKGKEFFNGWMSASNANDFVLFNDFTHKMLERPLQSSDTDTTDLIEQIMKMAKTREIDMSNLDGYVDRVFPPKIKGFFDDRKEILQKISKNFVFDETRLIDFIQSLRLPLEISREDIAPNEKDKLSKKGSEIATLILKEFGL